MTLDELDIRRRIKAARELAGLTVPELAARIDSARFGAKAIGSIERGERKTPPGRHELEAIAKACGLPYEFFTVDFERLALPAPGDVATADDIQRLDAQIRELSRSLAELTALTAQHTQEIAGLADTGRREERSIEDR